MQNAKATRMEYLKLKKQLKTAKRGHKLLKEKRDGLMKKFMAIIKETKTLRKEMEESLSVAGKKFAFSTLGLMEKEIEEIFSVPSAFVKINAEKENIMSVWVPKFNYSVEGSFKSYSDLTAPLGIEPSLKKIWQSIEIMIKLAEIEHTARLLSFEIEKTRRRVNALEHIIIPRVQKNMKHILSKLDEQERAEKIIRLKIKEMMVA